MIFFSHIPLVFASVASLNKAVYSSVHENWKVFLYRLYIPRHYFVFLEPVLFFLFFIWLTLQYSILRYLFIWSVHKNSITLKLFSACLTFLFIFSIRHIYICLYSVSTLDYRIYYQEMESHIKITIILKEILLRSSYSRTKMW